jgi:hypothetical protein
MLADPILALRDLVAVFDKLSIAYFIGGSFASGARGEFRATNDIDVICQITPANFASFIAEIKINFIVDEVGFRENFLLKKAYNILHEETFLKVDLFSKLGEFEYSELERATTVILPEHNFSIRVASAEDVILSKLRWYRSGGEQSERQWSDVLGVVRVQAQALDLEYLKIWAEKLGVADLLQKLIRS